MASWQGFFWGSSHYSSGDFTLISMQVQEGSVSEMVLPLLYGKGPNNLFIPLGIPRERSSHYQLSETEWWDINFYGHNCYAILEEIALFILANLPNLKKTKLWPVLFWLLAYSALKVMIMNRTIFLQGFRYLNIYSAYGRHYFCYIFTNSPSFHDWPAFILIDD